MSYMALMKAQAAPHSLVYSMPAKSFADADDMISNVMDVRTRMRGPTPQPRVRLVKPEPVLALPAPPPPKPRRKPHDFLIVHRMADAKSAGPRWQHSSAEAIIAEVCAKHRVSVAEIKGKTRHRPVVEARFEAYFHLHQQLGYSLPMIGRAMGGKEHTGVMHGIRRFREKMGTAGL